jgi:L-lactate dehydrogenase complex protein LldE
MRVALFITCFNDTLFPETGRAVVTLLERLGCDVEFPEAQTCCGQMHLNSGYADAGLALAERFERVFAGAEAVVSPSASCVGMVREHCPSLAGRVHELTEFLVDVLGVTDVGATFPHRVTLHPTCHSLRLLRVGDRPRRLLQAVQGIDLVDMEDAEECCGFGGTFAVKNADTSMAMLSDKLRRVLDTRAEVCTAADTSCLMHIGGALTRQRAGVRVMHIAEILAAQE